MKVVMSNTFGFGGNNACVLLKIRILIYMNRLRKYLQNPVLRRDFFWSYIHNFRFRPKDLIIIEQHLPTVLQVVLTFLET
jgi:hypothetical protein